MSVSLEYLAGFFDGEGSIGIYRSGKSGFHLRTQLVQNSSSEVDILYEDLQTRYGGCYQGHKSSNGRRKYNWQLNSHKAVVFLKDIAPFLVLKKEQAELAIEWQTNRPKPIRNEKGQIESKTRDLYESDIAVVKKMKDLKK